MSHNPIPEMSWYHEKALLVVGTLVSSGASFMGAVLTAGETRWLLATFGSATFAAVFLALGFRRDGENTRVVLGKCGIAGMIGLCIIKFIIHRYDLTFFDKDIVALIFATWGATAFGYLIGFEVLALIGRDGASISKKLYDWLLKKFLP